MAVITLQKSRIIAVAQDKYLKPTHPFKDTKNLGAVIPEYGQDITFATGRKMPKSRPEAATTEAALKPKMKELLNQFASSDKSGVAKKLFTKFLAKNSQVEYFDDPLLDGKAKAHTNIQYFMKAALNAPPATTAKVRIHQALKNANWDINTMKAPKDLGVPAFNKGNKDWLTRSEDFTNGLGVMINGVQYVYIIATDYRYDSSTSKYDLSMRFLFYDVFGLDDDDVVEYGADGGIEVNPGATWGITSWWQLQHQFNYAPLVTRITIDQTVKDIPAI